jgi:hypothetical protein
LSFFFTLTGGYIKTTRRGVNGIVINYNGSFVMNGGKVTVTGNSVKINDTGSGTGTFTMNGGVLSSSSSAAINVASTNATAQTATGYKWQVGSDGTAWTDWTASDDETTYPKSAHYVTVVVRPDPTYTVTIPAILDGETLKVSTDDVANLGDDQHLSVSVASDNDFTLRTSDGATLDYYVTAGGNEVKAGGEVLSVSGGETAKQAAITVGFGTATYSGTYTGTLTFTISVEANAN